MQPDKNQVQPTDHVARELALDISLSHHVEAPAGSGKTMLLVARFIKLLRTVRHPHEILALTFTNKAAGEMKARIVDLLQKADRGGSPGNRLEAMLLEQAKEALRQHNLHRYLLLSPDGLQVTTFHGFCYTLIRRAPLEARIPPQSVVMEDEGQTMLLDESILGMIRSLVNMPDSAPERTAFENRLLRADNRLPVLVDELKDLVKRRDLFYDLHRALRSHGGLEGLEKALNSRFGAVIEGILRKTFRAFTGTALALEWTRFRQDLKEKGAPNADGLPHSLPGTEWKDLSAWKTIAQALTTTAGKPRKRLGPSSGGFYKGFAGGPWGGHVKNLPLATCRLLAALKPLPEQDERLTDTNAVADLIILVAYAVTCYETVCRQQHLVDFVDLENSALKTLSEDAPTDLQLLLDHRIQHILVDEFQDTSQNQWDLLQLLCAGWEPGDGRTIFLVGDPKQSIYAFRKAEVGLFLEAKKGIPLSGRGCLPLIPLRLEANFRSGPSLVAWTNRIFGHSVMASPEEAFGEVSFQPSTAQADGADDPMRPSVSLNLFFEDKPLTLPAEAEAGWLARMVRHLLDERLPGASIGILLFTRSRLRVYLNALRNAGVSVRVKQGLKIADQPEIIHLCRMAAALCRPHDNVAWASLMRSPWAWADTSVLLEIASLPAATWSRKLSLAADVYPEVKRVQRALQSAGRRVGRDPLGQVVRELWTALNGPERTAASFGAEGVFNCRLFMEILESVEKGIPEETLLHLNRALQTLYAPASPEASPAPVDLMTVHGAKGLEFDVVFLPFLDWRPLAVPHHPPYLVQRSPEPPGLPLIAMASDRRLSEPDKGYQLLKTIADTRELGEAKRVLYVGTTRARKALFLSGVAARNRDRIEGPRNTPLDWLLAHGNRPGDDLMETNLNPEGPPFPVKQPKHEEALPDPLVFEPQPFPYTMESPSELKRDVSTVEEPVAREAEPAEHAAIRGTVTHRVIQTLWLEDKTPELQSIAAALASEGMNLDAAYAAARGIADEIAACQKDDFFQWLLDRSRGEGQSEYALEGVKASDKLYGGILDFVKREADRVWIVDFKTSRPAPGQSEAEFLRQQTERYRPQLAAYRAMLAGKERIEPGLVRTGLYFTSIRRWHEIPKFTRPPKQRKLSNGLVL